jgi:2',3'-cyclic-nucleotide 2'-phosphodiesterase (5'-nucleotidase family)
MNRLRRLLTAAAPAVLLFLAARAPAEEVPIVLLHTTDLHGRLDNLVPEERPGEPPLPHAGLLRIATLVKQVRAETAHVLLLDGGDTIQGTPDSLATAGRSMVDAMNRLRYDAWTLGNHEFDWGIDVLRRAVDAAEFPVLAANIRPLGDAPHPLPTIRPFVIRELGGVRVAVVGLATPGIPRWTVPELLGTAAFAGSVETLDRIVPVVREQAPDILVLLVHQGYRDGYDDHASQISTIVRTHPEFDVVLGGHSHEAVPGTTIGRSLYVQSAWHGSALGRIDLVYDTAARAVVRKQSRLMPVDETVPPDAELEKAFAPLLDRIRKDLDRVVGHAPEALAAKADRPGQGPTERLIRAAIREASGADVAIHGALSESDIEAGPIRERDVWRVIPYENRIGVAMLDAAEIRSILEEVLGRTTPARPAMGLGGLVCEYDPMAPAGARVLKLLLPDGKAPHPRKRFATAFNSYTLASGGTRYMKLLEIVRRPEARLKILDADSREAVRAYLSKHDPIDPASWPDDGLREKIAPAPEPR